ncbi:hypothetical protein QJS10_CPB13g00334 [Acorus calamus]|uniref:Uncharacterized protein n=1 Tax=Acorus calamus TaxID=4465 RepID=A0AAV9DJQ5_ACOCL|nr:hypothetical protein QJS10_CPB13g00334 [Acorus calamus]
MRDTEEEEEVVVVVVVSVEMIEVGVEIGTEKAAAAEASEGGRRGVPRSGPTVPRRVLLRANTTTGSLVLTAAEVVE